MKIVDEFTGRILEGRRWSEGLHQAVEAKEGVQIKEENQTLATVTLQNYFRMYDKLAGMTGTASTEAGEFAHTYGLEVVSIPTNRPMVRADEPDLIYKTEDGEVRGRRRRHRRALRRRPAGARRHDLGREVGAALARCSRSAASRTQVLNAKQHEREAHIVTQAGRLGAVTVATNMAGRGVDILLGGNPEGLAQQELLAERHHGRGVAGEATQELRRAVQGRVRGRGRPGPRARRPLRARHRAPREPPHRQPAPRPRRPPGRPGREPLLPLARRRAHAPVRDRRDELGDGQGVPRRRAARGEDGHEGDRARAAHGRGPQLRDPQGRPQVRRGDERAAQGHLPAPPADPRRRRPPRRGARGDRARRSSRARRRSTAPASSPRSGTSTSSLAAARTCFPTRDHAGAARRRSAPRQASSSCSSTTRSSCTRRRKRRSAPRRSARSSAA